MMNFLAQHPWIAIVVGTGIVGSGGLLATWGWNQKSQLSHYENLISGVAEEWRLNDQLAAEAIIIAQRWNSRADNENFPFRPFKSDRARALISSGFRAGSKSQLVLAVKNYDDAVAEFTARQQIAGRHNPGLFIVSDLIHNPPERMPETEDEFLAAPFLLFLSAHRHVGEALSSSGVILKD